MGEVTIKPAVPATESVAIDEPVPPPWMCRTAPGMSHPAHDPHSVVTVRRVRTQPRDGSVVSTTQLSPDLLTVPLAAKRLGLHPDSLYRLIRERKFSPAVTIGRSVRVSVPKLERYLHGEEVAACSGTANQ